MTTRVGSNGRVVIAKELRFLPPEHDRSLRGTLAEYVDAAVTDDALRDAEDGAWADDAARRDAEVARGEG